MPVVRELIPDGVGLINIDQADGNLTEEDPCLSLTPDSMGAILYTSGSTGQPKGVVLAHLNLLGGAMSSGASSSICPDDRITLLASYAFGGSLFSVFGSLLNAAAVLPFDVRRQGIDALPDWLAREEITIYYSVPTVFRNLGVPSAGKGRFPTIRLVCLGGETILRRDLDLHKQYFPDDCLLRLGMGMTEAGGVARIFLNKESEVEGSVMPAGYPVAGVEVLLLDEEGNEVPCGEVGEIVVKSPYLARGYWRKPELTKARFRSDPQGSDLRVYYTGDLGHRAPDGCLYHRGRADFQVKVRGHRVELSEVETALLEIPQVKEGAVRAIEQDDGTSALAAYVVPQGNPAPTVTDLRAELTARLPNHMMPSAFVLMDAMPRTATGKVDRLALPEPDGSRPPLAAAFVAPRTPIEEAVADVWSRLLGVAPIGVLDSFFDLGGHSLLATQMISRLRDQFDVELPLADFFASPTAERVALAVTQALLEKAGPQDAAELLGDLRQ
jgi:acyl-coenzyme A synthetase/AMP-(fatty) acid ligase/acyl carrier protein